MGKVIGCGFCPELADITGEHLWPDWFGRKLGRRKYDFSRMRQDGILDHWPKWALNEKANVVCGKCNSGWMSDLENKTKAATNGMALYCSAVVLTARDIALIAANAFKAAVVADLMHDNRPPFFPLLQRRKFAATLTIPAGVQMWLASMARQRGLFKSYYFATKPGTSSGFEFNVFTYGLGHLMIQVVSSRWKKKAHRRHAFPPRLTQNPAWDSVSIPFWPSDDTQVSWPPSHHLGDKIIAEFVNRWAHLSWGGGSPGF